MPKINFAEVKDVKDFEPLPDGKYLAKLVHIEESSTQNGDELWKLRFEVLSGEFLGRYIFDNLVFSEAAMKRVKLICSSLGVDVTSEIDVEPGLLKDRKCHISVVTEEYENAEGETKKRNTVPFAGYEKEENGEVESKEDGSEEKLPF